MCGKFKHEIEDLALAIVLPPLPAQEEVLALGLSPSVLCTLKLDYPVLYQHCILMGDCLYGTAAVMNVGLVDQPTILVSEENGHFTQITRAR